MKACVGWLGLALFIGGIAAGCGSNNSSSASITISPTSATILLGTSLQFIPSETGSSNAITWSVNGTANGNAQFGTISSTGLYTAPATRPNLATGVSVPVVFAIANSSIPGSGSIGSVIELQSGFNLTNFTAGNTINITGNSVAGWNGSFLIVAAAQLANGNFGVQIAALPGPPASGLGGTATATPNITITAQVQQTNAVASATISLDSGIRVSVNQPSCSIGTKETFTFSATVSGSSNTAVTWSITSGVGTIDPNSGLYTAPDTAPASAGTATVTATSVADPTESGSATVTVVTAADPRLTSISPTAGAIGAALQQVYLTGTNFICTTAVFVNINNAATDVPLTSGFLSSLSSTAFLVNVPDSILSTQPTTPGAPVTLTFKVKGQKGTAEQVCATTSSCQLTLSPVRPAVVAATPDSVQQPSSGTFNVTLDGGYFGTTNTTGGVQGSPAVNVQFNGQANATVTFNSDRQLVLAVPASDVSAPGLYPINVTNKTSGSTNGSMAAVNLAVQPTSGPGSPTTVAVGTAPSSVAINTETGVAVVANAGTQKTGGGGHDITLIDLTQSPPKALGFICTEVVGATLTSTETTCPGAGPSEVPGPVGVAVDNLRHLALVANSGNGTLGVVDLTSQTVTALLTFPSADSNGNALPLAPQAVGINPASGRALVAFASGGAGSNAGAILDLTPSPPALVNVVNLNNGPNPHIAVSTRLNWALATPGGAGSLSIVDLGRQTVNAISSFSCSSGVVTATATSTVGLFAGQPVLISGASPSSLNGIFTAKSVSNTTFTYSPTTCTSGTGGTASYALPVASVATNTNVRGVTINDESQKALLVDPNAGVPAFIFNILDQTSALVNSLPSNVQNVASAMNPLTNIGVIVNQTLNEGFLVNPVTPTFISSFPTGGTAPVDVAIDPAANTALIVNQGSNNVGLVSLGTLRSASHIVQASFAPTSAPMQTSSRVTITSNLGAAATASDQTVTLIGTFPSGSVPRLDGDPSSFTGVSISASGRVMTATLSGSVLATNGPRVYALDVKDTSSRVSNAASLQVIQAVNLVTGTGSGPGNCGNPSPQGVAIDDTHNVALVTEPGCNDVALVTLPNSTTVINSPELPVGTNPQGVAVYAQAGLAVVANAVSNNVSIVDIVNDDVATTFGTDPTPDGVAVDPGTGKAVVTANGASLVDVFPVSTTSQTPTTIGVQQGPSGVAIDPKGAVAVVANSTSNTASIVNLSSNTTTNTNALLSFPQGVAFDPISDNFLITSSSRNEVTALNPNNVSPQTFRVGIDPSSIAYNFESGTLVTANNLSGTMTVVDFIDQTVRGIFSLPSSTQFAVAIHPRTNLAVVADTKENQLLLVPLPH